MSSIKKESERISSIISNMSLKDKIGQLCVPILQSEDIPADIENAIVEIGVSMIRYCPNASFDNSSEVVGKPNRYLLPDETAQLTNQLQWLAVEKSSHKTPLLIAVDQEGSTRSDMNRGGTIVYPGHMAFGATDDTQLTYKIGLALGKEFRSMGINLVQAPIVDVLAYEGRKTIKASAIGEHADMVVKHSEALMKGYKDGGIASMIKHFPGYGSIATDAHKGVAAITKSLEALENEDLVPFTNLFAQGCDGIMMGHVIAKCMDPAELPATLSKKIIKEIIRGKMGFDGIIETDAMRMKAIQDRYGTAQATVMAVRAGCDLVLLRGDTQHFMEGYNALLKAADLGELDEDELDESIRRILTVKENIGILDTPYVNPSEAGNVVGCTEHISISAELAQKSVTLLKNTKSLIPYFIEGGKNILVICPEPQKIRAAMDERQCVEMLIKAVRKHYPAANGLMVHLNPEDTEIENAVKMATYADVIIFGSCNAILYSRQAELVKQLHALGKELIVVAMESPFDIEEFSYIDTYLCTYGVAYDAAEAAADVIFGRLKPLGKIPVKIPGL